MHWLKACAVLLLTPFICGQETEYDLVVSGGTVVDGTGGARYPADVGIRGDRIVAIERGGIDASLARDVIHADGLVVADRPLIDA